MLISKKIFSFALSVFFVTACNRTPVQPEPPPVTNPPVIDPTPYEPQPTQDPKDINTNPYIEFKVLTLNVWGLPNPITKDLKERLDLISGAINGYDVVNLQETFSDNADVILKRAAYPYKFRMDNGNLVNLNAGLTTLSKYPIVSKDFRKFNECKGTDCLANKGVLFTRISVPEIGDVDIFNTHYQAMDEQEDLRVKDNQVLEELLKQKDIGNPTILTGDFNFTNFDQSDKTSKAYMDFVKRINPVDTFRVANPGNPGFTHDPRVNMYGDKNERPQRLDYIFHLPENRGSQRVNYTLEVGSSKIMFTQPVGSKFLSDHFGVTTTFKFYLNR